MDSDWVLLERFATRGDQGAFGELVRKHVDWVYGCARRMLNGRGLAGEAEDVTQAVFVLLSQKAGAIRQTGSLAGWLFRATRFCCANTIKMHGRREKHEKEAGMQRAENGTTKNEEVMAVLDEALAAMGEKERQAILLRYLQRLNTQQTAAALEVSAEAVEKRLERGLEKLRGYFVRQGYAVPAGAVAGVLATESIKSAPAHLAGAILGKGSVTAAAIAKGAAMAMAWHTAKVITAAACAVVVVGVTAGVTVSLAAGPGSRGSGPASRTNGQVATAPVMAPGEKAMMVRWDMAVTGELATEIRALAAMKNTDSVGYEAYVVDGNELRKAIAANANSIVSRPEQLTAPFMNGGNGPGITPDIAITNTSGAYGFVTVAGQQALINSGMISEAYLDQKRDAVRLKIEDEKHTMTIDTETSQKREVQVKFTGDVPVGKAAVFVGDMGAVGERQLAHVSVWEAFAATQQEWGYLSGIPADRWLGMTVEDMKKPVARGMAWNASVKDNVVPAAWEKRLEGGSIVRLYGVSNPSRWPWVWWNADGQAIRMSPNGGGAAWWGPEFASQREVMVELEDRFAEAAPPAPTPPGAPAPPDNAAWRGFTYTTTKVGEPLKLVAGSGRWTIGPTVAKGDKATVQGVEITVSEIARALPRTRDNPGSTWVHFRYKGYTYGQYEFSAAAVEKDGKVVGPTDRPQVRNAGVVPPPEIFNIGMAREDADHFVIRWRKTQAVTFEGFAVEPRVSPEDVKMPVNAASAPASAATAKSATATKPAVDLESPEGFFEKLLAAAKSHDAAKVRALLEAKGSATPAMADLIAQQVTTEQLVFDAAVAKFGEEDAKNTFAPGILGQRWPTKWKVEADRATPLPETADTGAVVVQGPTSGLVKVNKEWRLLIELPAGITPEQLDQLTAQMEQQRKILAIKQAFASDIAAGKFKDVYDARDELRKGTAQ